MERIIITPSKYIQGRGELIHLGKYVSQLGKKALCLVSESGISQIKETIDQSFDQSSCSLNYIYFQGECSVLEIERIRKECVEEAIDIVIGIGGGKIHDTAKAVGYYHDIPVVIVPTIASTDAPCSALSVIYSETGVFERYLTLKQNPNLVLVDSQLIANAPVRLLVSGMGDALSTFFEARACQASGASTRAGGRSTMAAMALANLCYETLLSKGLQAKYAVENHCCTEAVEKIIEANTFLSGIGFESGGLAAAHSIHNGLTILSQTHSKFHGEKVAYGTLVQLVLEDASNQEIEQILDFCVKVGLPVTLEQLGITEWDEKEIMDVARAAVKEGESIHNMPFSVCAEDVYSAILTADVIGRNYISSNNFKNN